MLVAVVGCLHGELDNVYENIKKTEEKEGKKIDLLICCGDFQATRNIQDLRCMAVPAKYQNMCSFYKLVCDFFPSYGLLYELLIS